MALIQGRLGHDHDVRLTLNARRHAQGDREEVADRGYHPHRGGRYDRKKDQSPSPEPMGPQAFGWYTLKAVLPPRYRPPTNILKYSEETNPDLWLEDYRLAFQADGVVSDDFIIRNLPLFLADSARTWLKHLPPQLHLELDRPKTNLRGELSGHLHPP